MFGGDDGVHILPLSGTEPVIQGACTVLLVVSLYLLLVVIMPLALSLVVSYRALPKGRACPVCRGETFPVLGRVFGRLGRRWQRIDRRWCPSCGWEGLCRIQGMGRGDAASDANRDAGWTGDTIEVRSIQVDGRPWRVLLRCSREADRWYGQLLFGAPSGRLWPDPGRPLAGDSPDELLTQAMLLPESKLAGRLRQVAEDA